jgi:hypothetical protein
MRTRPSTDVAIDAFVTRVRLGNEGAPPQRISEAPWIASLEERLPRPFPPSFRSLVCRYAFPALDLGLLALFANTGDLTADDELAARIFRDRVLADVLLREGYVQIGQHTRAFYDPVCFDTRHRRGGGEYPLVHVSHEAALLRSEVRVVAQLAESFMHFVEGYAS